MDTSLTCVSLQFVPISYQECQESREVEQRSTWANLVSHPARLHSRQGGERLRRAWNFLSEPHPVICTLVPDNHPLLDARGIRDVAVRLLKFGVVSLTGALLARLFAEYVFDTEYDPNYDGNEFWELYFSSVVMDMCFAFFLGRIYCSQGRDNIWFFFPMLFGCVLPTAVAVIDDLQVSITEQSIECDWTGWTWTLAILGVLTALIFVGLHVVWALADKVFIVYLLEACAVFATFVAPAATPGFDQLHFHHWLKGLIGVCCFHLDRRMGLVAQGFTWGIYLNGIGCWGRGALLPCKLLNVMLRTDADDCYTYQEVVVDVVTNVTYTVTRVAPVEAKCDRR
ncbi:hypothetical protein CYMTET_55483 [Cymbomonas tetramitiformis]|uniref:Uncharacterized protein n=1 Tax=Cymbomonas tetramitiformis TaxID=36881 RepID=A0AAE0ENB8_9CHLO|nr:hypothetical protein CYMTET_55483 [Cymbomonas tetramitiformis]